MTDRERYKRTFSLLQAPEIDITEVKAMKEKAKKIVPIRRMAALCAAVVLVLAMASVAYAADIGGIQRTVQVWINGDQTDVVLTLKDGSYSYTVKDENGEPQEVHGGGVAMDIFGNERPLTESELMEDLEMPQVEFREDGTVWVYCRDQKTEITDKFENGVCRVQVENGGKNLYLTVHEDGSYTSSPHSYVD